MANTLDLRIFDEKEIVPNGKLEDLVRAAIRMLDSSTLKGYRVCCHVFFGITDLLDVRQSSGYREVILRSGGEVLLNSKIDWAIRTLKEKGVMPALCTFPPMSFAKHNQFLLKNGITGSLEHKAKYAAMQIEHNEQVAILNKRIEELNSASGVVTCHLSTKLFVQEKGRYILKDVYLRDGLHPTNQGATLLNVELAQNLRKAKQGKRSPDWLRKSHQVKSASSISFSIKMKKEETGLPSSQKSLHEKRWDPVPAVEKPDLLASHQLLSKTQGAATPAVNRSNPSNFLQESVRKGPSLESRLTMRDQLYGRKSSRSPKRNCSPRRSRSPRRSHSPRRNRFPRRSRSPRRGSHTSRYSRSPRRRGRSPRRSRSPRRGHSPRRQPWSPKNRQSPKPVSTPQYKYVVEDYGYKPLPKDARKGVEPEPVKNVDQSKDESLKPDKKRDPFTPSPFLGSLTSDNSSENNTSQVSAKQIRRNDPFLNTKSRSRSRGRSRSRERSAEIRRLTGNSYTMLSQFESSKLNMSQVRKVEDRFQSLPGTSDWSSGGLAEKDGNDLRQLASKHQDMVGGNALDRVETLSNLDQLSPDAQDLKRAILLQKQALVQQMQKVVAKQENNVMNILQGGQSQNNSAFDAGFNIYSGNPVQSLQTNAGSGYLGNSMRGYEGNNMGQMGEQSMGLMGGQDVIQIGGRGIGQIDGHDYSGDSGRGYGGYQ